MKPLILLLLLSACASDPTESAPDLGSDLNTVDVGQDAQNDQGVDLGVGEPPELGPRLRPGRWYLGDFHVHATGASNDAGSESTPERIKEVMQSLGMDFVVLTDHSNSTGSDPSTLDEDPDLFNQGPEFPYWEKAAELSDETFLMIDGNEMSPTADGVGNFPVGHLGCYPRDLDNFDPNVVFIDRPRGQITGENTINQARDAGCYITLNHPFGPVSWIAFDWTSFEYDAVEIYNGGLGWDGSDQAALDSYLCDISQGRRVTALAGSDNHRINVEFPGNATNPSPGSPQIYVWAQELQWSQIIESLDRGHVTVSDTNRPIEMDAYDAQGTWIGMPGDDVSASDARWVRIQGVSKNTNALRMLRLIEIVPDACEDLRVVGQQTPPIPNHRVIFEREIAADSEFNELMPIVMVPGHAYMTTLTPTSGGGLNYGVGFTNPIYAVEP